MTLQQDVANYLTEAIPKTFPNTNLMPTTANEIKSIICTSKKIHHSSITMISSIMLFRDIIAVFL
jgi:hypothetical protein